MILIHIFDFLIAKYYVMLLCYNVIRQRYMIIYKGYMILLFIFINVIK